MTTRLLRAPSVGSPSVEPITTAEAKAQCDIGSGDSTHDTMLGSLITAARQKWERDTDTVCVTSTVVEKLDTLVGDWIELAKRPVQSVTSIYYYTTAGANTLLSSSLYTLDVYAPQPRIVLNYDEDWPDVRGHYGDVTVTYVAGHNGASNVPTAWKQAMLLLISHWFEHRSTVNIGNVVNEVPLAYESLAMSWRRSTYP